MRVGAIFALNALLLPALALAEETIPPVVGGHTYTQHLVEVQKSLHPEIQSIVVSGLKAGTRDHVILGSTLGAMTVFSKTASGDAADSALPSGDGRQYVVREVFLNSTGHRLGTIEIRFPYRNGQDTSPNKATAKAVQTAIKHATLSAKNAIDPWPYDAAYGPNTHAQALTEKTVAAHPDLVVMMIHATAPGNKTNVVIGSNIGRFGKAADEDDLRVIDQGSTNLEIADTQDRFEAELPLNDASGKRIGALGLVFAYRPGQDKDALHAHGRAIRDELAKQIPGNAALFAPR
jgi:hypothetical protein